MREMMQSLFMVEQLRNGRALSSEIVASSCATQYSAAMASTCMVLNSQFLFVFALLDHGMFTMSCDFQ